MNIKFEGGFLYILTFVLIIMKLNGIVQISWWIILLPLYFLPALILSLWIFIMIAICYQVLLEKFRYD